MKPAGLQKVPTETLIRELSRRGYFLRGPGKRSCECGTCGTCKNREKVARRRERRRLGLPPGRPGRPASPPVETE